MNPGERRTFAVPSRLQALAPIRKQVYALARDHGFPRQAAEDLVLCVHEALSNAIVHGNQQDEALHAELTIEGLDGALRVSVRNGGPGFDTTQAFALGDTPDHPRGRGMRIIASLTDEHAWADQGRELSFLKRAS